MPRVVLVSLLLTLSIFHTYSSVFIGNFEHVNADWASTSKSAMEIKNLTPVFQLKNYHSTNKASFACICHKTDKRGSNANCQYAPGTNVESTLNTYRTKL